MRQHLPNWAAIPPVVAERVLGAARASGSLPGKGSRRGHLYADAVLRRVFYDIIRSLAIIKDSGAVSPTFLQSFISLLQELVSQ
jgi:hypothetical protein